MSDSDEWEDNEVVATVNDVKLPQYTKDDRETMPESLQLSNFVKTNHILSLYRCEPANKEYPGICIPPSFAKYEALMVSIELHNAIGRPVRTRLPDFKSKGMTYKRRGDVVFVIRPELPVIYFKKKCQDKRTGKDIAFELGGGFSSHTGEITPQFTIVMTPFVNGRLAVEKAVRSPKFHVFSKRQDRHTAQTKKRHKKNTEILKMDTNIREAETTYQALHRDLERLKHQNRAMTQTNNILRERTMLLPEGPIKIALLYGTRTQKLSNFASI